MWENGWNGAREMWWGQAWEIKGQCGKMAERGQGKLEGEITRENKAKCEKGNKGKL